MNSTLKALTCLPVFFIFSLVSIAQTITGKVTDTNGKPLPFATIKFGNTNHGGVTNLDGSFSFNLKYKVDFIEVSYLAFTTQKVSLTENQPLQIILQPAPANFSPVIVTSNTSKLKRIINKAIQNRDLHNPDKYSWYKCKVYYKMVVDFIIADSVLKKDTSAQTARMNKMMKEQHILMTETISKRTWQKPASLQEEVIATRMSGFQKSLVSSLVTDVLPFHAYGDFINLNGKEVHNPISKGQFQKFQFRLEDEILQGNDTMWIINFKPKNAANELAGNVYIHSDGFAIARLLAHTTDTILKRDMAIEHQYGKHEGKWFPQQLNYTIKWIVGGMQYPLFMKGSSIIDSVTYNKEEKFKFDKAHTIKLIANADELKDSTWRNIRPAELQPKEARTYQFMDSAINATKMEKFIGYMEKLSEGKFPLNKYFDVNLNRLYTYNQYESSRIGWGMQTTNKVFNKVSLGGWAGYGFKDKDWKYGAFAEWYADKYKEFVVTASYYKDIRDPGRLQVNKDIDQDFLRMLLMKRVDKIEGYKLSVKKRFGYLAADFYGSRETIIPAYNYNYKSEANSFKEFSIKEAGVNIRYGFGERSAPVFGRYYRTSSNYPVIYGRIYGGKVNSDINYTQVIGAINWSKNINRWGNERFRVIGGLSLSNKPLPLSKTFAANGFKLADNSIYYFGGMQTIAPYEYYSDKFINFYWTHDFPFRFYDLTISKKGISSTPGIALGFNGLLGDMKNQQVHKDIQFKVPQKLYHETGLILTRILRLNVLGFYYATLNIGYFYHWTPIFNAKENGKLVFGIGADL